MATFYTELNTTLREFIAKQGLFFTATATSGGRINLSPKAWTRSAFWTIGPSLILI